MLRQPHVAGLGQKCVAVQITLFFCNPTTTVLLAWVCLGEPLVPRALAGIACSLAGVVVVTKPPFLFGGQEMWTSSRLLGAQLPRYRLCIMAPSSPSSCSTACKPARRLAQAAEACWTLHQTRPAQPCCACAWFCSLMPGAQQALRKGGKGTAGQAASAAGVCCGISAALTSSMAFVAIRKIARAESALAIALWFYASQLLMGVFSLMVWPPARCLQTRATLGARAGVCTFRLGGGGKEQGVSRLADKPAGRPSSDSSGL